MAAELQDAYGEGFLNGRFRCDCFHCGFGRGGRFGCFGCGSGGAARKQGEYQED